jgi:hypothetical protein
MHSTSANQLTLSMWKWKRDHEHKAHISYINPHIYFMIKY